MALSIILGENSKKVKIGEKEYELSPLTLWDISLAEDEFECDLESFQTALKKIKNLLFFVFLSLKKKTPALTFEQVGGMFQFSDVAELGNLLNEVMKLSGLVSTEKKD